MTKHQTPPPGRFIVITDPGGAGDAPVDTEYFETARERLESLRARTRAYFPNAAVPAPLGPTPEDEYLALLLSFFLMLSDGKVTLAEIPGAGEEVHAG